MTLACASTSREATRVANDPEIKVNMTGDAMVIRNGVVYKKKTGFALENGDVLDTTEAGSISGFDNNGVFTFTMLTNAIVAVAVEDHSADNYIGVYLDVDLGRISVTDSTAALQARYAAKQPPVFPVIRKVRARRGKLLAGAAGSSYYSEAIGSDGLRVGCTLDTCMAWNKVNFTSAILKQGNVRDVFPNTVLQSAVGED